MRGNLEQKLRNQNPRKPNFFSTLIAKGLFAFVSAKNHVSYQYSFDKKYINKKNQVIVLASHATYNDYNFVLRGINKLSPNVVCGYEHFFIKFLYSFLISLGAIPKYLYQSDLKSIHDIDELIKMGQSIVIFPEGIQSTSGSSQPLNPATIKFLVKYKLPVIVCKSYGAYLANPRFSTNTRQGKRTYQYDLVLTKDDYEKYNKDEIYEIIRKTMYFNDFEYNRQAHEKYIGKVANAEGIEKILYICPDCGHEFTLAVKDDSICCSHCGYQVKIDEYYDLSLQKGKNLPKDIDAWYKMQRHLVKKQVLAENFELKGDFYLYAIDNEHLSFKTQKRIGEGKCLLNKDGFFYKGCQNGKEVELAFPLSMLPSIPFSPGKCVDIYYNNALYSFYKKENPNEVVKWMLAEEELHNIGDEKWRTVSDDAYYFDESMIIKGAKHD